MVMCLENFKQPNINIYMPNSKEGEQTFGSGLVLQSLWILKLSDFEW